VPRFSANLALLWSELPFLERFAAAAGAGFDAVEYLFPYPFEPDDLARRLREHGLRQDLFNLPAGDFDAGERGLAADPSRRDEFREGVERALRYADALGCRKLNCLAGLELPTVPWEDQLSCLIENLRHAAERVGADGRTLMVELLNTKDTPGFFVGSLAVVERTLDEVDDPHLRFQCDVYHLQRSSGDLVRAIESLGPRIGHYQIADAPDRHEPGTGEIAYPYVLEAIDRTGYDGSIGLEYRPSGATDDSFGWIERYGYGRGVRQGVRS
jgi:hydroxypyruvate isomerase